MSEKIKSAEHRLGFLLLRDGHAIPLRGISPEEIKQGAKHRILHPDADQLQHRKTLNAIVDRLGFSGDFGDFLSTGWPDFERFLKKNGCTSQTGVFPVDHGGCIDLHFGPLGGPTPRQLSDRIFYSDITCPARVFLGYGVDWSAWDNGDGIHCPQDAIVTIKGAFKDAEDRGRQLFKRRHDLMMQWGFLDDKLIYGDPKRIIDKTYWAQGSDPKAREESQARVAAAVRAFRAVFNCQSEGWVDVKPYNDRLVVLRAHDGKWDILWRNYRESEPPQPIGIANSNNLQIEDIPSRLMTKSDHLRKFHFRQDIWEEREEHEAEQAFYDRGGKIWERRMTSDIDVRISWLKDQRLWSEQNRAQWTGPLPNGFKAVLVNGRSVAMSDIVDVASFRQMLIETGYGERRNTVREPWERANDKASDEVPVGASWTDAQAYCAWRERQLGVNLRLPTQSELRAIRPAYSKHYESMAFMDFPWENFPPRPIVNPQGNAGHKNVPSAVTWSESRFLEVSPDMPEFPDESGVADRSGKRWIKDFPPCASWKNPLPWVDHEGLAFIDAWDSYEWCQEKGVISGRFWEGEIGSESWGAYKNIKVTFRVVIDLEG